MIRLPRRSVTRFFIPLIDVLILLFAIFLLMPYVSDPLPPEVEGGLQPDKEQLSLPTDVRELQQLLQEERRRVARLEQERQRWLSERLHVCVLHIDPQDGTLYHYDAERQDVRSEADALRLIARQKALAGNQGKNELYFLILWPRTPSAFPTQAQETQYRQWFRDVPLGFDRGGGSGGEK
ncbi:MAG: hypothetical protein NZU63_12760 [Gemmataceae bacterium]|nr:hypothetical protein [Gemmataceae bacterium]